MLYFPSFDFLYFLILYNEHVLIGYIFFFFEECAHSILIWELVIHNR